MTVTLVDDRRFPSAHLAMDFRLRASRLLQVWASLPVRAANSAATARAMLRRPSGTLNSIHSSSSPLGCMHRYTAHGLSIFPRPRIGPIARKPTTRNRPCKLTGRAGVVGGTQEIAFRLAQVILLDPGSRRWSPTVASSTASHLPQGVPRACPESCSVSAVEGSGKPAWGPFCSSESQGPRQVRRRDQAFRASQSGAKSRRWVSSAPAAHGRQRGKG